MCYCTCAGVETATEKWGGGGGGRDFLYHIACEVRHLGGFGGMPPPPPPQDFGVHWKQSGAI